MILVGNEQPINDILDGITPTTLIIVGIVPLIFIGGGANGAILIKVGNASSAYGTLTSSNIASSINVSASYCTIGADCALPASIVNLSVVAGSSANTWIATDSKAGAAQGNYSLTITPPTFTSSNSSGGGYLNCQLWKQSLLQKISTESPLIWFWKQNT